MSVFQSREKTNNEESDNPELLQAIQQGDREAFWTLWLKYAPALYDRCLVKMNGNHAETEDVLSDCMLKALQGMRHQAANIKNVEAWLNRLVGNHCIDIHRQRRNAGVMNEDSRVGEPFSLRRHRPDEHFTSRENVRLLLQFASQLPPNLKTPFVLHFVEEAPYGEIAQQCGINPANVRKRIQLARETLKMNLEALNQGRVKRPGRTGVQELLNSRDEDYFASDPTSEKTYLKVVSLCPPRGSLIHYHTFSTCDRLKATQLAALELYVEKHPRGWKKQLNLAEGYELAGRGLDAVKHYRSCLEKRPANLSISWRLSQLLHIMGRRRQAVSILENTGNRAGKSGLVLKGQASLLSGRLEEADALFQDALEHNHNHAVLYHYSFFLFQTGQASLAKPYLQRVLVEEPHHLPALTLRLEIARQEEDPAFSSHLEHLLKCRPHHPLALKYWVDRCIKNGEKPDIFGERWKRLVRAAPRSSYYLESRCLYYQSQGREEKALHLLTQYNGRNPSSPGGFYRKAYWLSLMGLDGVEAALNQANLLSRGQRRPRNFEELKDFLNLSPLLVESSDCL